MKTYLEYKDEKTHKFWQLEIEGNCLLVCFGKVNTKGQSKTKEFDSLEKANKEGEKLIKQKLKKGYQKISTSNVVLKNDIDAVKLSNVDYYLADKIRFYEKSVILHSDLSLDFSDDENENSTEFFKGIVVDGDLRVNGNITNFEDDFGKFLDVKGNLYVNNLIIGGSDLKVEQKITSKGFVVQTYNHGEICADSINCEILVSEERSAVIEGLKEIGLELNAGCGDRSYELISQIYYYCDEGENYIDINELIDEIVKGNDKEAQKLLFSCAQNHFPELLASSNILTACDQETRSLTCLSFLKEFARKIKLKDNEISIGELINADISDITFLDLSNNDLEDLPECLCELVNIESLILTSNEIKKLPDFIGDFKKLKSLFVENNNISSISKALLSLTNLQELNLSENKVRTIPKSIKKLENLVLLNLYSNKISGIPVEIGDLKKLTNLNIGLNHLDKLACELFNLVDLEYLDISFSQLNDLANIEKLTNLKELSLYSCGISQIPKSLFKLKSLIKLNLRGNSICEIPQEIEWLNLSANPLGTIPYSLLKLKSLNFLDLFLCRITEVPSYISDFSNLKELRLDGNDIKDLDNIKFPSLTHLSVDNMKLSVIPKSITDIISLNFLKISSNYIKEIPDEIGDLKNLKVLLIGGYKGEMNSLPSSFVKLSNLEKLDLSSHQFSEIPKEIFELTNLVNLDLAYNRIKQIPKEIGKLINLEVCHLNKNEISNFPEELTSLKSLRILLIYDNKLNLLPENIGDLENLESAYFGNNNITIIPSSIVNLKKIKNGWFHVLPNPIGNIPEDILKKGFYAVQKYFDK